MEKGKLIQIGTPHDIYFKPSNLYVVLYLVKQIFFNPKLKIILVSPLGRIKTSNLSNNQEVDVVVRPEAIKLNLEKSPLLNPNSGVVVDSKFLGNSAIIHMTVNDEKIINIIFIAG